LKQVKAATVEMMTALLAKEMRDSPDKEGKVGKALKVFIEGKDSGLKMVHKKIYEGKRYKKGGWVDSGVERTVLIRSLVEFGTWRNIFFFPTVPRIHHTCTSNKTQTTSNCIKNYLKF
jgi:hypothetical protein